MSKKLVKPVIQVIIGKAMRKLNFTRKKKLTVTKKGTSNSDKNLSN
jgi:hypothetical protein